MMGHVHHAQLCNVRKGPRLLCGTFVGPTTHIAQLQETKLHQPLH